MGITGWGGKTTLYVEADFGQAVVDVGEPAGPTGNANWDLTTWSDGVSTWAGRDPVWTDITASVRGISTSHAFSRQTNRYSTSSATVTLDNNSGAFSPTNTNSPYRLGASTTIGLLRRMRIRVAYTDLNNYTYNWNLYDGLIQSWDMTYPEYGGDAVVVVSLQGAESRLGNIERVAQVAQGAGDTPGARIQRILNDAGWSDPSGYASVDTGETTLQATTLAGSVMNELQLVADSEGGYLYWDAYGNTIFDGYNAQVEKQRLLEAVLFSNAPDLFTAPIGYEDIAFSYNADLVTNYITYQNVGGTAQTVASPNSRSLYGDRITSRTDLIAQDDAHALRLANRDLAIFRNPELRVESLTFSPMTPTYDFYGNVDDWGWRSLAQGAIALRRGAHIVHNPKHETAVDRWCFIDGIAHDITPKTWRTTLQFSSASAYRDVGSSVWDGASGVNAGFFDGTRWGW